MFATTKNTTRPPKGGGNNGNNSTGSASNEDYLLPDSATQEPILTLGGKQYVTAAQLAKLIGKHVKWLERKRWEGGGPAFRYIGKTPIYEISEAIKWVEAIPTITNTSQLV